MLAFIYLFIFDITACHRHLSHPKYSFIIFNGIRAISHFLYTFLLYFYIWKHLTWKSNQCFPELLILYSLKNYLFGCTPSSLWYVGFLVVVCELFCGMGDLVLWPGTEPPGLLNWEGSLSHRTTREVPLILYFVSKDSGQICPSVLKAGALGQPRGMECGGRRERVLEWGDTCTPVADSCQCMAKPTTIL